MDRYLTAIVWMQLSQIAYSTATLSFWLTGKFGVALDHFDVQNLLFFTWLRWELR